MSFVWIKNYYREFYYFNNIFIYYFIISRVSYESKTTNVWILLF